MASSSPQPRSKQELDILSKVEDHDGTPFYKFSWLNSSVNLLACPLCVIYENSPCQRMAEDYHEVEKKEPKTKNEERRADQLWDKLFKCMQKHKKMFEDRKGEQDYVYSVVFKDVDGDSDDHKQ